MDAAILNAQEKMITDALNNAEAASRAAQQAIADRDIVAARSLITEALQHTLTVLSVAAKADKLDILQNVGPAVEFYIEQLSIIDRGVFGVLQSAGIGSAIGALPRRSDAENFVSLLAKLVSKGGL